MFCGSETANSPAQIVNLFADHFESTYNRDTQLSKDLHNIPSGARGIVLSLFDVDMAISKVKPTTSMGPDEIHSTVVNSCADALVFPLWLLFQKSLEHGTLPSTLKTSRVIPLFKEGDRKDVTNYRIIAIGSIVLKIFESALKDKLFAMVNEKLSNCQHGFRPQRSINTNLINLSMAAHTAMEKGHQLDVFYGDFKSAFDKVSHQMLIDKLGNLDISNNIIKWIYSFLSNRKNYVTIGNVKSRLYESPSGVPAGSILGPLLFLIFIDDIAGVVDHSEMLLFADDIKIFTEVTSSLDAKNLQSDIANLLSWCKSNQLHFNFQKCAVMTISRRNTTISENYT